MRPLRKRKITAVLASAVGAAVLALGTLAAGAVAAPSETFTGTSDGPQSANVPYVAWVGEHVRLVACDPSIETSEAGGQLGNFHLEDWSGKPEAAELPESESGSQAFFAPSEGSPQAESGDGCVKIDYKSLSPGLARIRAVVTNSAGTIVYSHQFIVIWLTVNKPTISEAGLDGNVLSNGEPGDDTFQSQLSGEGHSNLAAFLGDPAGNGEFAPSPFDPSTAPNQDKGLIQIKVTGSFPVEPGSLLHNLLPEASYTLPESWPTLAKTLATSNEELEPEGTNPNLWDIHETATPTEATTSNAEEPGNDPLTADYFRGAFDNDTSGATATVGPFDPEAADETLLSDNNLNAEDAPMPAMRIDVSIAKNEGAGLGGVGQISGASKALIYSHNFNGDAATSGNLYNPYYGEYIPATARPEPQASGIDGPSHGGDFPGFLNKEQPYVFWNSVHSAEERSAESTGCTQRLHGLYGEDEGATDYLTPGGPLTETFYTDERGEAYATYTPGDGFYLNHLPVLATAGEEETGKLIKNADGGCDLKNLYKQVIGESSISATAIYPYQSVDFRQQTTETPLVKKVKSYWEKEFFTFPKGPGPNEQNVRIVVAKAQDIDGRPIPYEIVCFHAQQEAGIYPFSNSANGNKLDDPEGLLGMGPEVELGGSYTLDPQDAGTNRLCVTTNSDGLAGIDVVNSTSSSVDLTAKYECEGIIRDHLVSFSTNIGSKKAEEEKVAAEEKAAAEKKAAEEKAAAEKKAAEEKAAAEKTAAEEAAKKKGEEEVAAEKARIAREDAAEEARITRENEAEKRQDEKEAAKEEREKATAAEITKNNEKRAEEEKTEATRRAKEAAEEKARREAEVKAHEEAVAKLAAKPLVSTLPGALPSKGKGKGKKAHLAKKRKGKISKRKK
jgi:hypothetical protein